MEGKRVRTKDDRLYLRISKEEKINMKLTAQYHGFDSITQYLMYLYRNDSKEIFHR